MKKIHLILLTAITLLMTACGTTQTVPLTGRKHRISVSDEQLLSLSQQQYSTYMQKAKKSTNAANTQMVVRVGRNLANAVETYLRNNGFASEVNNFHWEFNLIPGPAGQRFLHARRQDRRLRRHPALHTERGLPGHRAGTRDRPRRGETQCRADDEAAEPGCSDHCARKRARSSGRTRRCQRHRTDSRNGLLPAQSEIQPQG